MRLSLSLSHTHTAACVRLSASLPPTNLPLPLPLLHNPTHSTSEIKDYLADNPAFAKTFVDAGASYLAANPDVAVRGAQSAMAASWAASAEQQQGQQPVAQAHAVQAQAQRREYEQKNANQFANQF